MKDLSVHMSVVDGKVMLEWNTCGSEHGPVRGCYAHDSEPSVHT